MTTHFHAFRRPTLLNRIRQASVTTYDTKQCCSIPNVILVLLPKLHCYSYRETSVPSYSIMALLNTYQPLDQQESSESLEDIEKCSDGSSAHSIQKSTIKSPLGMALTQWIPWILVISLISSNWYTWLELKSLLPEDAIFSAYIMKQHVL